MLASVKGRHIHPLYIFPFFMHIFPHPPLLCLIIGILMWHSPYMIFFQASTWILLLILFILAFSVGFALSSLWQYHQYKTTINPHNFEQTHLLVTTGVYRLSRNPMYLSLLLVLIAIFLWKGSLLSLIGIVAFVVLMNQFQIKREEQFLLQKFGEDYRIYLQKVRRWI